MTGSGLPIEVAFGAKPNPFGLELG